MSEACQEGGATDILDGWCLCCWFGGGEQRNKRCSVEVWRCLKSSLLEEDLLEVSSAEPCCAWHS